MGMTITKDKHDRFHQEGRELSPKQHAALMKRLGVTKEEDEEWHRTHFTLAEQRALAKSGMKGLNPYALGGAFLNWCQKQGWVVCQRKQYFVTSDGARELQERFEIEV